MILTCIEQVAGLIEMSDQNQIDRESLFFVLPTYQSGAASWIKAIWIATNSITGRTHQIFEEIGGDRYAATWTKAALEHLTD